MQKPVFFKWFVCVCICIAMLYPAFGKGNHRSDNLGGGPVAKFKTTGNLCISDTVKFISQSTGYSTLYWDFGDGTFTWDLDTLYHIFQKAGPYTVRLKAIAANGIENIVEQLIIIEPLPSITLVPSGNLEFDFGDKRQVEVQGSFERIIWYKDNSVFSKNSNSIMVSAKGNYECMVVDNHGCHNKKNFTVTVNQKTIPDKVDTTRIIVVNNVLTPNGDGINDHLEIADLTYYTSPCAVYIYNILGDLVFQCADYRSCNPWDGNLNGKQLDAGTYYYLIKSTGRKGEAGFIDIIR